MPFKLTELPSTFFEYEGNTVEIKNGFWTYIPDRPKLVTRTVPAKHWWQSDRVEHGIEYEHLTVWGG